MKPKENYWRSCGKREGKILSACHWLNQSSPVLKRFSYSDKILENYHLKINCCKWNSHVGEHKHAYGLLRNVENCTLLIEWKNMSLNTVHKRATYPYHTKFYLKVWLFLFMWFQIWIKSSYFHSCLFSITLKSSFFFWLESQDWNMPTSGSPSPFASCTWLPS